MILHEKSIKLVPLKEKKGKKDNKNPQGQKKGELKQEVERLANNHMSHSVEIRCMFALLPSYK